MNRNTHMRMDYESPECILLSFPAEGSICAGSPYDKAGIILTEGGYWYEY